MEDGHRSTALRILAPLALLAAALALVLIITSASGDGGTDKGAAASKAEKARDLGEASDGEEKTPRKPRDRDKLPQRFYIVKKGDSFGSIAETTGVPVEKLQDLNPDVDQFSLVAGQRIKLR